MEKNSVSSLLTPQDNLFTTEQEREEAKRETVIAIPLTEIDDFPHHPFKVRVDENMLEMMDSVREHGVLIPAVVRPKADGKYEMVSGHRRKRASEMVGKEKISCIVRDLTDDEAIIIMVDSNLQREKILPSEKAFAYKMKLDAMKRQGERADLTCDHFEHKLGKKSREILGEQVGVSSAQVARYIRLTELIPNLLEMVDSKKLNFTTAVDISYIDKQVQGWLYEYICDNGFIKPNQIVELRKFIGQGNMTQSLMISILNSTIQVKAPSKKVTFNEKKLTKYFPEHYSSADMERVIVSLLEKWKEDQEES